MTAFALRAHTAPQPASLAYMHLSMLLSFLDIYAHACHFASDVFSFHRPITHPACASGLGCIPIESPHSLLRSLACICRCCSLVSPYANGSANAPDATARNHAAVVARAPAPKTNQPAATVRGGAGPRPNRTLQSAPAAGRGRGPGSNTPSPPLGPAAPGLPGTPK